MHCKVKCVTLKVYSGQQSLVVVISTPVLDCNFKTEFFKFADLNLFDGQEFLEILPARLLLK